MNIVIAGAGDVGFHLAELLSVENKHIILIDTNQEVLDHAATHLDVLTLKGDSSSMDILKQAEIHKARLVLAVTTSEKTNLVTAILAKKMGAKQTIARVSNSNYFMEDQRTTLEELGIDSLISPRLLAAREIHRLLGQCSFTDIFEFEDGKINLVGITLSEDSNLRYKTLNQLVNLEAEIALRPVAILRGQRTILPTPDTILRRNDHIYFVTLKEDIEKLERMIGKKKVNVKNVMIAGGTGLAFETAKMLEKDYNVTIIEKDKDYCRFISEQLNNTLIIHGEASNIDMLMEEGLENMDAYIALTPNSETNIITCLTAKNHGVHKTIAQVEQKEYTYISQDIGVDTLINKKLIAANNIFRFVRKGRVEAITSLHGVDAEIIEFIIHKNNQLTKKPIKQLPLPQKTLIAGIVRGEEGILPSEDFQLQINDRIIIFALPEAISKLEKLFR